MIKFIVTTLLFLGVQHIHAQTIISVQEIRSILTGNSWTNGFEFVSYVSPDKYDVYDVNDVSPTDSNTLVFMGGTLHEFGTNLYLKQIGDELYLDKEREYQLFPAGSRVVFVAEDNALVFRHPISGELLGVLKMLPKNLDLRKQMEEDLFTYGLIGTYVLEWDPTVQTAFSELCRIDSPLFEEQGYSFGIEYDIPQKILHIGNAVFAFKRRIYQLELIPLKFNAEEEHYAQIKGGQRITLNRADKMKSLDYKNLSTNILTEQQLMLYAGHYPYDVGVASQKSEIRKMLHSFSVMRNQIFAELGYIFKKEEWRDYFTQMNWYKPEYEDVTERLSEIQKINVEHIQRLEKKWKEEMRMASAGFEPQILLDLLAIPELEGMDVELVSKPLANEHFYTYKAGKRNDQGVMTSPVWFRVYVNPDYEIKVFDVEGDKEITLAEWQRGTFI